MTKISEVFTRRRIIAAISVLLLLLLGLYLLRPKIQTVARQRTEAVLRARFASDVQISDFRLYLYPSIHVYIRGLVMRHEGRIDIPPLV